MVDLKHKKADVGQTLTWLVAFAIIFFMIVIFIIFSGVLATKKAVSDVDFARASNPERFSEKLFLSKSLAAFLSQKINDNTTMYDVILMEGTLSENSEQAKSIFREKASEFLKDNLKITNSSYLAVYAADNNGNYRIAEGFSVYYPEYKPAHIESLIASGESSAQNIRIIVPIEPGKKLVLGVVR